MDAGQKLIRLACLSNRDLSSFLACEHPNQYPAFDQIGAKPFHRIIESNFAQMLTQHLVDCLAAVPPLRRVLKEQGADAPALLDVGAGAGLPGVVFAILHPQLQVHCVDTVAKKAAFVQQVAVELKLPNLRGLHARVESLGQGYDIVSSRAFASLVDFTTWSRAAAKPAEAASAMAAADAVRRILFIACSCSENGWGLVPPP